MSELPDNLHYTKSHEWVAVNEDGTVTVGITDHAQDQLGDMVYIEPPEVDKELEGGDACTVVESVKAASDVYAPLAGTVVEVNEDLADSPELVNQDPYAAGWLFKLQPVEISVVDEMLDADAYQEFLETEA
ncbi:MAG: glycine cleavage system protein GcvH [Gammaproteobacteria bacterium]